MKQVYYPYNMWEEVRFGMYRNDSPDKDKLLQMALELLSNPAELQKQMEQTLVFWPNSTERNLTCPGLNKQAWLGQAACCFYSNVPENITKEAWSLLTDQQRIEANDVADKVIIKWNKNYAKNI